VGKRRQEHRAGGRWQLVGERLEGRRGIQQRSGIQQRRGIQQRSGSFQQQ
jgi:hypothetical protein